MVGNVMPLDDRVLVQTVEAEDKTPGGILLPDKAKERPLRGKVLAVGPGKRRDDGCRNEMFVKVGDQVLFTAYAGSDLKSFGKGIQIMSESDILAVLADIK